MNINFRLLSAGAMSLLIGLSSCNNDEESDGSKLSKTQAKSAIADFNTSAKGDLQDLADADGLVAVQDFFTLVDQDDPFGRIGTDKQKIRAFFREKGSEFRNVFVPVSSKNGRTAAFEPFDYDSKTGVYVWDDVNGVFVYEADDNIIRIQFPTEGSTENNAELRLNAYEDQMFEDEFGDIYYDPTLIDASVYVDDVLKASFDLSIDFDDAGFPVAADITVMVTPFTASVSLDASGSTTSSISVSLRQGQETLAATSITVRYADASKSEESLKSVEGFVQLKNLKLQGSIDAEGANGEEIDFNDFVKLALYTDNKKIGDIVFEDDGTTSTAYVQYSDGTKEALDVVMQPVIDEVNALSDDFGGNG